MLSIQYQMGASGRGKSFIDMLALRLSLSHSKTLSYLPKLNTDPNAQGQEIQPTIAVATRPTAKVGSLGWDRSAW